jgi:serine/threonine protein kinase
MNRNSFSKERTIGEGGCGIVEVVWHPDFEEPVARKRLLDSARSGAERDRNIARFRTEVQLLQERLDHPNVIKILYADFDTDDPWFIMPLAPENLSDIVPDGGS